MKYIILFFLVLCSAYSYGSEPERGDDVEIRVDSFHHKVVFWELHSDDRVVAYVDGYGCDKNVNDPQRHLDVGTEGGYLRTEGVQQELKRCARLIYESLSEKQLRQLLEAANGGEPLAVFININKLGRIDMVRVQLSAQKALYVSAEDICNITDILVDEASFRKPTDFHLNHMLLILGLKRKTVLEWLEE